MIGKHLAGNLFEIYSAGTDTKPQINQDAVRLMKELYRIGMEKTQRSKLIDEIPEIDIVITMGCNVHCPYLPCEHREDWGLDDPTYKLNGTVNYSFLHYSRIADSTSIIIFN